MVRVLIAPMDRLESGVAMDLDNFISKTKTIFTIKDPIGENELRCNCVYADDAFAEIFGEVKNDTDE